ncbi:27113_t:CDS:1, partial [Gigaspora margarita]
IAKKNALNSNISIVDLKEVPSLKVSILWTNILINTSIRKMLQTIKEFTIEVEWLHSSQIQDLVNNSMNTNVL